MPGNQLAESGARHSLVLRGATHGAVLTLVGVAVVLTAPAGSAGPLVLAAALLGAGAGLMLIQVASRRHPDAAVPAPRGGARTYGSLAGWRTVGRRALTAGGFGLAAAASYLVVGWVPLILFVSAALVAAGWAQVLYLRGDRPDY